jgi:hypothetical protein
MHERSRRVIAVTTKLRLLPAKMPFPNVKPGVDQCEGRSGTKLFVHPAFQPEP